MSVVGQDLRNKVVARANGRCEYCQVSAEGQIGAFPIDHITPRNRAGTTVFGNLALSCPRCNAHKWAFDSGFDPLTGSEVRLFHPRENAWSDHFEWSLGEGRATINGKTPIGRATVERLKMNAEEVLEIRHLLWKLNPFWVKP